MSSRIAETGNDARASFTENWQRVTESRDFARLFAEVRGGARVVSISGLVAAPARALVAALLQRVSGRTVAVVAEASRDLETWSRDVGFWHRVFSGEDAATYDGERVVMLPASENDPYAGASPHAETLERRALALSKLAHDEADIVLLTARSLARRMVAPAQFAALDRTIKLDEDHAPEELVEMLVASGYVREDPVSAVGGFSLRGGILDVWSPQTERPVRLEFFGDTVDSIREFDAETQLSVAQLKEMHIVPMRELAARASDFRSWTDAARERFADARFARSLADRKAYTDNGEPFAGWEWMWSLVHETDACVLDHLPPDCVLLIDEPGQLETSLGNFYSTLRTRYEETDAADEIALTPEELYLSAEEMRGRIEQRQRVELRVLGLAAASIDEGFVGATDELTVLTGATGDEASRTDDADESSVDGAAEVSNEQRRVARNMRAFAPREASTPLFLFPAAAAATEIEIRSQAARRYHNRIPELAREVRAIHERERASSTDEATAFLFVMPSAGVAERIAEIFSDYEVTSRLVRAEDELDLEAESVHATVTTGNLTGGFVLPESRLVVHVESDLFDEAAEAATFERRSTATKAVTKEATATTAAVAGDTETTKRKRRPKSAAFLSDFRDLKAGDYVVHIDHGIARFQGLQTLELGGGDSSLSSSGLDVAKKRGEFMLLTYADEAKLYVPVERLDLVQRYSSAENGEPQLDKLGGLGWLKTKAKAKRAMRDMADELLKLYAERKLVQGYSFAADSPWQQEFEDGFEYQLTVDQATAIEDVKTDMEARTPMDRLLCGDVGYGKTEVAMRAAFKAVMESKQVAILTPTTVLAYQHYETLKRRFAAFPVKVELLSRFRSTKEQKEIVKRIEAGEIDVLVGTHRLLSKDVAFRELGLVVVDEEQRFGVAHKERLKQLKKRVDVLTLSATPIPRTLNMSLMGLRDMSVIETPPRDRLSINTQVVQFGEPVIKSAIELELSRQGQIFFIHNRVETIDTIAALVKRIVPQARIIVAHGQMNEKEMEDVMLDFIAYKHDVLVATTIIENGIDIPRANTIIINRADNYGLSQLYQLRGRVGRSNRRAYSYLLIPSEQSLTPIARRRLAAIREFSDLGAGFRVAALDLELRGAGSLLGGQQSGHMDALGFDLYTQMLERTVSELRGEEVEDDTSVSINLGADVAIPQDYINDMGQRLRTYKRIASAGDDDILETIRREIADRYGKLPVSVENLIEYSRLRRTAERMNVISIDATPTGLSFKMSERARVDTDKLLAFVGENEGVSFSPNGVLRVALSEDEREQIVENAIRVLLQLRADG